jgi:hypothetical protein
MAGAAVLVLGFAASSCGGSSAGGAAQSTTSTSAVAVVRSYMLEAANNVYWVQLKEHQVDGVFEEVLGPMVTPDHQVADWVYRLNGTLSGDTMTFHFAPVSPGEPAFPASMTGTLTAHAVTLKQPFTDGPGEVLRSATQKEYDIAARAHVEAWTHGTGSS